MAYQWKKWTSAEEEKIVQEKLLDRAFLVEKLQKTPKNTIESAYLKSEYKNKGYGNSLDAASLSGLATKGWDPSASHYQKDEEGQYTRAASSLGYFDMIAQHFDPSYGMPTYGSYMAGKKLVEDFGAGTSHLKNLSAQTRNYDHLRGEGYNKQWAKQPAPVGILASSIFGSHKGKDADSMGMKVGHGNPQRSWKDTYNKTLSADLSATGDTPSWVEDFINNGFGWGAMI